MCVCVFICTWQLFNNDPFPSYFLPFIASAKCNFDQETKPHRLNLDVGDAVIILKETTHWYYGYKQK